ncbi:MAG: hypothetical protein A3B90_00245 [Candidatus Magasanikbacteria bacterium RIFCSPHIGHO2_02_FULL_41_13]|uniref:NGG1p interacting factor NIF3 n=1 Tax=Candidatus Magasanikbacteria bacterium RIFCSPHIGHO2_02_FULL_41_13 TaxID=1798676 RepID=A0A1F6M493_9BACT|nr:MAG: hypothetical protein A3B90_00245 [Candidatus Magasanikbacteria bacterium RIFCSPHIGHO2_02_FULL_41_13]
MKESNVVKIQVNCPRESADAVRLAIGGSGGGVMGKYKYCSFVTEGHGYFLPMDDANPAVGNIGEVNRVPEVKIEFVCEKEKVKDVITAIKSIHPYEEIPIDIFPMLDFK